MELKCLGFKNGRKIAKHLERFCRVWRLLNGTKRRYLHGLVRLPGTKPCKLRWLWAVYASKWPQNAVNASVFMFSAPPIFNSGLKPRYLQVFLWRKGLLRRLEASKWHKATVLTRASAPSCHKTLYIDVYWDGFKLCTLQSGHKTP